MQNHFTVVSPQLYNNDRITKIAPFLITMSNSQIFFFSQLLQNDGKTIYHKL